MTRARAFLRELRREIELHPAVNHLFLNRLATSPFSRQDYRVFAENHYPLVCVFTAYLERLLVREPSSEAKLWLAKVLIDEYGEGSRGQDHASLYAKFRAACGEPIREVGDERVPAPALAFIRAHCAIVARRPTLEGFGAVGPGHEWAIPKMFESVLIGLRRAGFSEHEIEYFSLHVEQDQDHGRWLEEALARFAGDDAASVAIRRGALASLAARGRFWNEVERAIVGFRQPYAARLDGPTPRSLPHEILLTAWDGSRAGRAVERTLDAWQQRRLPTLGQLLEQTRAG